MSAYSYSATVIRWVDGDTVWLDVDLGFRMRSQADFRLYGIDTPESGQPGRNEATAFAAAAAPAGTVVQISTFKNPDKYGRWLVEIITPDGKGSLNARLVLAGLAVAYFGGKKAAVV